jgi:uncharacterized protein (DUF488 family)
MKLYTIGHSNHPLDNFVGLLRQLGITCLVDIRSKPYSRFYPQFNKRNLEARLPEQGVSYIYMGDSLGGRPSDPTCYKHQALPKNNTDYPQEIDYAEVMQRPWFIQGINKMLVVAAGQAICLLCSEGDPTQCHRQHLIAEYLFRSHPEVTILHILRDGSLQDAVVVKGK